MKIGNSARPKAETVYFDVTTLMNNNGRVTGITRVEMCLVHEMLRQLDVDFIAWHQKARRFFKPERKILSFEEGPSYQRLGPQDIEFLDALPKGSRILLQGNAWLQNGAYVDDLDIFVRRSGADLTLLIHDILPVSHSQYFPEDQVRRFDQCLERMVDITARFLVDSEATAKELRAYLRRHRGAESQIGVIRLGDGFQGGLKSEEPSLGKLPDVVQTALAERRFVLSVGSLSPHKNRRLLYDVWARLYERLGEDTPTLLIAGGVAGAGPEGEHLAVRLKRDGRTRSHIHVVHGLDDSTLELLYRRSLFTVFPSLCEGWGLPVTESLLNGKICIASATSSMVEIAPECTDLVDPLDSLAWVDKATLYSSDAKARSTRESFIRTNYRATPWAETVKQLIVACQGPARALPPFRAYAGQVLDLSNTKLLSKISVPGERAFEANPWGGWISDEARLTFDIFKTSYSPCELVFLTAFRGRSGVVKVLDGENQLAQWRYNRSALDLRSVEIPANALAVNVNLHFQIESDEEEARLGIAKFCLTHPEWPDPKRASLVGKLAVPAFRFGETIPLGDLKPALAGGWHALEASRIWSDAGTATLLMSLESPANEKSLLRLRLSALMNQPVTVAVNGVAAGSFNVGPRAQVCEVLLTDAMLGPLLWVEITPAMACQPSALTWSKDNRTLGVSLSGIELTRVDESAPLPRRKTRRPTLRRPRRLTTASSSNQPLDFAVGGNGAAALGQGWHAAEADHVWSTGSCLLKIASPHLRAPRLKVTLAAYLPQTVELIINGEKITDWVVESGGLQTFETPIAEDVVMSSPVMTIEFVATAAVPAVMSDTPDGRALGVALGRLWFEGSEARPASILTRRLRSVTRKVRAILLN